jgi:hypothetical protein
MLLFFRRQLVISTLILILQPLSHVACAQQASASNPLTLTSPLDYQVFQRETRTKGRVLVAGDAHIEVEKAEARVSGISLSGPLSERWQRLALDKSSGRIRGDLKTPAGGFYKIEVRLMRHGQQVADATVPHLGVGEVFVIAGQSNATNYGEVRQKTQTGMVVSFDGSQWAVADDPQPGVQDNSKKGSFIPSFGDALYRKYQVPIGVADVGHGSTSVRQWLPEGEPVLAPPTMSKYVKQDADGRLVSDGTLFNGFMTRIRSLGRHGFRAVLWHQGESDANQADGHQITPEQYKEMLEHVIRASRAQAGWDFPWFTAEATYHNPQDQACEPLREAQRSVWTDGVALEGPDTDTLTAAYRQNNGRGVHFNDAGLKAHGNLWAEKVEAYLDHVLR